MSKRIYVGGLPFTSTEDEVKSLFGAHGQVTSVKLIMDKYSGQPRGFGFVEMANDNEATTAIEKLNGYELGGKKLTVNEARPMADRGNRGGYRGGPSRSGGNRERRGGYNRW
jgi:RNA recognition motif-containing protein